MRALQLIPILLLVEVCHGESIFYVYPIVAERIARSQHLEKVNFVYPYVEEVEVMTPVPLEEYYRTTTDIPETTTDIWSLESLDNEATTTEADDDDTTIITQTKEAATSTTPSTTTTTTTPSTTPSTTTTEASEVSSTERGQKSILSWKERMLERLLKRPKFPAQKIQTKFLIAQNYGKSRYSSNKTYKSITSTTTTEEPSSTLVTRRAFNRAIYSSNRRRTTTEIPKTTTTSTSETPTSTSTTSEPSYRKKFGRGRARLLKLRRAETGN